MATSNLRPYQAEFYDDVFLTAYEEQQNTTKSKENDIGILMTETIVGVTNKDLAVKYAQVYDCAEPSIDDIRNKHTEPLVRMGVINKHESRINRNENLYSPVEDKSKKKNLGIDKFEVAKPGVFPTKELLEESLRNILGNHGEGGEAENEKNN